MGIVGWIGAVSVRGLRTEGWIFFEPRRREVGSVFFLVVGVGVF